MHSGHVAAEQPHDFNKAHKSCDLVMKGGITSGVVYPPALLELAREYRFNSIGGTSAGAIAAAAAAAAEHGRESGGFEKLNAASKWLGEGTNLFSLFQPAPSTAPLYRTLVAFISTSTGQKSKARLAGRLFGAWSIGNPLAFAIGALLTLALALVFTWLMGGSLFTGTGGPPDVWRLLLLVLLALLGGVVGSLVGLANIALRKVPANFFGICTGYTGNPSSGGPELLTGWFSRQLDDVAGLPEGGPPLTFAMLSRKQDTTRPQGITLQLITTNLSHRQQYKFPFKENIFLFKEADMRRLFPEYIVRHMVETTRQSERISLAGMPGYHFLPKGEDMPVVVAARMSLSVPPLISAVPLYTIKPSAYTRKEKGKPLALRETDLQSNWFTDGGVTSNFPVHLFDRWLPRRPTLAIQLTSLPEGEIITSEEKVQPDAYSSLPDVEDVEAATPPEDVVLPKANEPQFPEWKPVAGLFGFFGSILDTAREHLDNTQSLLPSYRERIVQIRFAQNEGGMNLTMDPDTIKKIVDKGQRAGQMLSGFSFDHHRWVRFLVLMAQIETQLAGMRQAFSEVDYPKLLEDQAIAARPGSTNKFPYPHNEEWCREALARARQLLAVADNWAALDDQGSGITSSVGGPEFFGKRTPRPEPLLRTTPEY
jgi:predicted acylesterase/phospholipase RssA